MNINPDALNQANSLAVASGKVESKRLAKAMELVSKVIKTFTGVYTDKSRMEEYFVPGSAHTGYSITVRNQKVVSACTCKDYQKREAWCKHRISIALIVRAESIMPGSVIANVPLTVPVTDEVYRRKMLDAMYGAD